MAKFSYDIVENDYGKQLAVSFDYDKAIVQRIKQLPWERTHRSWSGDHEAWLLDYTDESIRLFEDGFDVIVPPQYKPEDGYQGDVEIVVPDGYTWFFLENPPQEVNQLLYQELSYQEPNAEYTDAYQDGSWDGVVHIYKKAKQGGPVGLIDRAVELIEELGYDVTVDINGYRSGTRVTFDWQFEHSLRQYQQDAVAALTTFGGGVVSMPTGTGKTVTGLKAVQELGRNAIVTVHTQELLYQWADEIEDIFGERPGMIGDGQWSEDSITVAIMQTLVSRGADQLDRDYGTLVFDECHRTSAADTMHQIGMDIDVKHRIGLSATPWRRVDGEELKIEGAIGGQVYEVGAEQMIDEGFLARPEFETLDPSNYGKIQTPYDHEDYHDAYQRCISLNPVRNSAIAHRASELADQDYKVLINVDRVAHGKLLAYALDSDMEPDALTDLAAGMDAEKRSAFISAIDNIECLNSCTARFMHGADSSEARQELLSEFENGDIDVLVSTLLKEGVDIPSINSIVLAQAGKSDISQIQTIGRALRPQNGDHARIVDVEDRGKYFEEQFEIRQTAMREYYGSYGPDLGDITARTADGKVSLTANEPSFEDIYE